MDIAGPTDPESAELAGYCTISYVAVEAGAAWLTLGSPDRALDAFTRADQEWNPAFHRDHGLSLARRASAYAGAGEVTAARHAAEQAIEIVTVTRSSRTLVERRRARDILGRSAATLTAMVDDIAASLSANGVRRMLIVNGHGGNYVLSNIVQEASVHGPSIALFPRASDWEAARVAAGLKTNGHDDMHAGELETSILLHAMPGVVRPSYAAADHHASDRPHMLTLGLRA